MLKLKVKSSSSLGQTKLLNEMTRYADKS